MKNEFVLAFNEVLEDKQLPKDVILEALQAAMVSAYRRAVNASNAQHVEAIIDPDSGKVLIYAEKEVVETVADSTAKQKSATWSWLKPRHKILVESLPKQHAR